LLAAVRVAAWIIELSDAYVDVPAVADGGREVITANCQMVLSVM
jgi:hypothetical protein